jgi:chromosome segregation ATPase
MKAIRNEAIAANKAIQNQLAEEKRLKEEAKEAKRKEEAEKAAARKAEREAKKKNNVKKQLNAANNILNLADKALKKKENNRRPTLTERGSYTSKINTQMKKLAKGTNNKVREDWEKKKKTFKGRITRATTLSQVKKAYENAKEAYNKLK